MIVYWAVSYKCQRQRRKKLEGGHIIQYALAFPELWGIISASILSAPSEVTFAGINFTGNYRKQRGYVFLT